MGRGWGVRETVSYVPAVAQSIWFSHHQKDCLGCLLFSPSLLPPVDTDNLLAPTSCPCVSVSPRSIHCLGQDSVCALLVKVVNLLVNL